MKNLVKTETTVYEVLWVRLDFARFDDNWMMARIGLDPLRKCFGCGHEYDPGEWIALVALRGVGNQVICRKCAEDLEDGKANP